MLAKMRNDRLLVGAARRAGDADRDRDRLLVGRRGLAPSFFPGHQAGSSHVRPKHGLAAFLVELAVFVFVCGSRTGPKRAAAS